MSVHTAKKESGKDIQVDDAIWVGTEEVRKKRKYTKRSRFSDV